MIFVTLGSQKFQFNRVLIALDEQILQGKITDPVFAQTGYSDYQPKKYEYKNFLSRDEFSEAEDVSDIVISHGGSGAIIGALKKRKKVIAIPRLAKYGEHVDDHQLQLLEQFKDLDMIYTCLNCDDIWRAINEVKTTDYKIYQSNTMSIVKSIDQFISEDMAK